MESNPARLLRVLLEDARAHSAQAADRQSAVIWRAVLAESHTTKLARFLIDLYLLPAEIRRDFRSRGLALTGIDAPLETFEAGSLADVDRPWNQYWQAIDGDHLLTVVRLAEQLLDVPANRCRQPIDNVIALDRHLSELRDDIVNSDLPEDVKRVVLPYLDQMIETLEETRARTTSGFWRIAEALAGRVGIDRDLSEALESSDVGKRILAVIASISVLVNVATLPGRLGPTQLPKADPVVVVCIDPSRTPPALPAGGAPKELEPGDPTNSPARP